MASIHRSSEDVRRRRVLNPRALIVVACVLACLSVGSRQLHDRQLHRTRQFLRTSAAQALQAGDDSRALSLLSQYLTMRSADPEARDQMSRLLVDFVGTPSALDRAFRLNEDLLRDKLPQHDLRLRQARLAIRLQRWSAARAHLQILEAARSDSSEIWYLAGQVAEAMREPELAESHYRRSTGSPSPPPEAFEAIVRLTSDRHSDPQAAHDLMDRMVAACPVAAAFRIRAGWLMQQSDLSAALEDLWRALEQEPDDPQLNALLVDCFRKAVPVVRQQVREESVDLEPRRVIAHFRRLTASADAVPVLRIHLSAALWHAGLRDEAITSLEDSIRQHPREYVLHRALVEYLLSDRRSDGAQHVLRQLPPSALLRCDTEYLQGRLRMAEGRWLEAAQALERSVAWSRPDWADLTRAQTLLATAHRSAGHRAAGLDAYRRILAQDPNSVAGRLGMASARLDDDSVDLAIAEYRQLLDVPGVPAFLASLMIDRCLRQPSALRDWRPVEQLLRDVDPLIEDPVQRALLQADLRLAAGDVTSVLPALEAAAAQFPDRVELRRAVRRLNGEYGAAILERLEQIVDLAPGNETSHAAILRFHLATRDTNAADSWLVGVMRGRRCPALDDTERIRVSVAALLRAEQLEQQAQRTESSGWLQAMVRQTGAKLIAQNPEELPWLVREFAVAGRTADARRLIPSAAAGTPADVLAADVLAADVLAAAWFELVRFSNAPRDDLPMAAAEMHLLIRRNPADLSLRLVYAEMMLCGEHYEDARDVLTQVVAADPTSEFGRTRLTWIRVATDPATTMPQPDAAEAHSDGGPDDGPDGADSTLLRVMRARIQIAAGKYQQAIRTLAPFRETPWHPVGRSREIPRGAAAAAVCEAVARLRLSDPAAARRALERAARLKSRDPLLRAEAQLLQKVQQELSAHSIAGPDELTQALREDIAEE